MRACSRKPWRWRAQTTRQHRPRLRDCERPNDVRRQIADVPAVQPHPWHRPPRAPHVPRRCPCRTDGSAVQEYVEITNGHDATQCDALGALGYSTRGFVTVLPCTVHRVRMRVRQPRARAGPTSPAGRVDATPPRRRRGFEPSAAVLCRVASFGANRALASWVTQGHVSNC